MKNVYEGGDLLVEALMHYGTKEIFSVSGGPINSIYHAAAKHGLPLIHSRHEAGAGFMADAVAKTTGRASVAAVTLGPATSNVVTNALMAKMAGTPMLIIGGQGPLKDFDRDAEMVTDSVRIMNPVTKFAARVVDTDRIPEYVDKAWRIMWAGRPGPVFLEIPMDVLSAPAQRYVTSVKPMQRGAALTSEVASNISQELAKAKRSLLIVGDEAFWELSHGFDPSRLRAAVERHQLLFSSLRHARGIIDERHDLYCGLGCTHANATLRKAMSEADLILLLGHQMESDLNFGESVGEDCVVIQAYADSAYHGAGHRSDIATTASVASVTELLLVTEPVTHDAGWTQNLAAQWRAERTAEVNAQSDILPMHPAVALDAVVHAAPKDTIYACGAGNVDFWIDERIQARTPGTQLKGGLAGGLGADVPYGLGAKVANPHRPVIVFLGDGSIGYHGMEIDTAARYNQQIVVIVLDDHKWGAIAVPQAARYNGEFETDLPERDWPALSRALGGIGMRAETRDELEDAVVSALASDKPALIHVPVRTVLSPFMAQVGI